MTEPTDTSFSAKLSGPPIWRIAVVAGASLAILMSAALTMGASRAPSAATSAVPAAGAGSVLDPGPGGLGGSWHEPEMGDQRGFDGPGFGIGRHGFGQITITAISGSNLSLRTVDGWTRTIAVSGSTAITKGGQEVGIGDLEVGDQIRFRQTRNDDGTFTINAIDVVLPHVAGEVTAKTADTITVARPDGASATIHVGSGTTYRVPGAATPSLSDITVGMFVAAEGTLRSDGSLSATVVLALPAGGPGWGPGRMHGGDWWGFPSGPAPSASPSASSSGA